MFNRLSQLKKLWALSKKEPKVLEKIEELTPADIAKLPDVGEPNGVFIADGSQKDYEEFQREENGLAPWYKRILNL